jgi:hypothetical protein
MKCSICEDNIEEQEHPITGEIFWNKGHNAEPINDGRCCDICNDTIVIVKRMEIMGKESWTTMDIDLRQHRIDFIKNRKKG